MTSGIDCLALKETDARLMIAADTHLGNRNADFQMEPYVFGCSKAGLNIFNCKKTWEKIVLAARAIAAVENPADVFAVAGNTHAQRAVLKFSKYTGATAIAGRFTPGTLTNQIQAAFREPRLLIVCCPRQDHQAVTESRYVNLPVIALCNSDSKLTHVDIAVPCNNVGDHSLGLVWWLLTRQVLRIRGTIPYDTDWEVMPDLFFYRSPEEQEKELKAEEEEATSAAVAAPLAMAPASAVPAPTSEDWGEPMTAQAATTGFGAVGQPAGGQAGIADWGAAVAAADDSWGAPVAPTAGAADSNW